MPVFTLDQTKLKSKFLPVEIEDKLLRTLIFNAPPNKIVEVWNDLKTMQRNYRCENKPKDYPPFGIRWIEVEGD